MELVPNLDLAGFPKNGRILDLPETKSGTTLSKCQKYHCTTANIFTNIKHTIQ